MKISYLMCDAVADFADLSRRLEAIAALGYHGVELTATHPLGFSLDDLANLTTRLRLPVVSLLSGWSYANEGLCLASPDAGVRDAMARLGDYIGHAARLGSLVVIGLMQGLRSDEPDEQKANDRIAGCLELAASKAAAAGVYLVLEPVNHQLVGFNHTAAQAAAMVRRVGSPALGYMLDTIHMNIEERSVLGAIREHGSRIRHFHLCESNGGPFGTGNLDFTSVLKAVNDSGYQGYLSTKIYRNASWQEAAASTVAFLSGHGIAFQPRAR